MTAWGNVTMIDAAELAQLRADLAAARELIGLYEANQVRDEGIIAGLEVERDALRARLAPLVAMASLEPLTVYAAGVCEVSGVEGMAVVLDGSKEAIKAAGRHWGEDVLVVPLSAIITVTEGLE